MKAQEASESGVFHVPENYFPELNNNILAKIQGDEAATPLILGSKGKTQTFTVPEGYFDLLEQKLLRKTALHSPARRLLPFSWRQIAAALVAGLVISGSVYYLAGSDSRQMAVQNSSNGASVIHNISINELADFVGEGAAGNTNGSDKKNAVDINQLFQQVSSQDLEGFLNETAVTSTELF